jgi:hypothetical protein
VFVALAFFGCILLRQDRGSSESEEGEVVLIADIEGAERLGGVACTAAEREQMGRDLEGQIASAVAPRKFRFENSLTTVSRFDPRLPNDRMPAPSSKRFSQAATRALAEVEADIAFSSIGELPAWTTIAALTSRRPTDIFLSRIDALGPKLECFAIVTAKRALTEADAAIVRKLRAASMVLLGKTAVGAFAYNDIRYGGWTRNPWNLNEGFSGSSAGSGLATAREHEVFQWSVPP